MEYCKEGLRLIQEASHENIMEFNVSLSNTIIFLKNFIETISRINYYKNK